MVRLETDRLIIRNFISEDWRDLYDYLSIKEVLKYEPDEPSCAQDCSFLVYERSKGDIFLAVCLKDTGKMIGHVFFNQNEPSKFMSWELGYIFNPAFYGKGYATEACKRVMEYAFEQLKAHRIMARCNPENVKSWRLLERLGMRREGYFKKRAFFRRNEDGTPIWHDAYEYALLDEEWNIHANT